MLPGRAQRSSDEFGQFSAWAGGWGCGAGRCVECRGLHTCSHDGWQPRAGLVCVTGGAASQQGLAGVGRAPCLHAATPGSPSEAIPAVPQPGSAPPKAGPHTGSAIGTAVSLKAPCRPEAPALPGCLGRGGVGVSRSPPPYRLSSPTHPSLTPHLPWDHEDFCLSIFSRPTPTSQ